MLRFLVTWIAGVRVRLRPAKFVSGIGGVMSSAF